MLIPVDIGRTFPLLGFFQEEGPQHEELRHVLEAYVCLRPDIGYVQGKLACAYFSFLLSPPPAPGMSFIAAVLLLNMDCYMSFQCLANVLNRRIFLEFFRMNMIQIRKYMLVLEELMVGWRLVCCIRSLFLPPYGAGKAFAQDRCSLREHPADSR